VRDWTAEAEFEVTLVGELSSRSDWHAISGGCGGEAGGQVTSRTTFATGTVMSENPAQVTATLLVDGRLDGVLFQAKDIEQPPIVLDDRVQLFGMTVRYDAEKETHQPGLDPLPPAHVFEASPDCADGEPQSGGSSPDCGAREYGTTLVVNARDTALHLTSDRELDRQWLRCGTSLSPSEPLAAPRTLEDCAAPVLEDGAIPRPPEVFDPEVPRIEVNGTMSCSRSSSGSLSEYRFDWTLVFCRIVEGQPAC